MDLEHYLKHWDTDDKIVFHDSCLPDFFSEKNMGPKGLDEGITGGVENVKRDMVQYSESKYLLHLLLRSV